MKTSIKEQFSKPWARSGPWIWWLIYSIILQKSAFPIDHCAVVASKHMSSVRDTCSSIWAVHKTVVKVIREINGYEIQIKTFLFFRLIHSALQPLICRLPHPDHQEIGGQDRPGATLSHPVLWLQAFPKACEVVQGPSAHWALREVQNQAGAVLSRAQDHEGEAWGRRRVQVQGWDCRDRSHAERWRYWEVWGSRAGLVLVFMLLCFTLGSSFWGEVDSHSYLLILYKCSVANKLLIPQCWNPSLAVKLVTDVGGHHLGKVEINICHGTLLSIS